MSDFLWLEARAAEDYQIYLYFWPSGLFLSWRTAGSPSNLSAWPFHLQLHVLIQPASWYGSTSCFPLLTPLLIFPRSERGSCIGYMNYTFLNSGTAAPSKRLILRFCTSRFRARIDRQPAMETLWRVLRFPTRPIPAAPHNNHGEGHLNSQCPHRYR
jgi:hypothetical protein